MTLADVIDQLDRYGQDLVVFARRPWNADADCVVAALTKEDLRVPPEVLEAGYEYFLDLETAREVLTVLSERETSLAVKVALLLHYATFDAYPDWALPT